MSQKLLFIFNPHAGKGQIKNHLVDIVDMMVKAGFDVTIYTTQAQADATRKVVEEGAGYDRIVCSGGDGTLDEVMTGLMQAKLHIPIGYIPAGSTNDFANSLGIPKEMLKAACFNNIGPGFDVVGPTCNFSVYSWFSKLVLIFDMLAGRLEIFPMLVLFSRSTWRHK